MFNTLFRCFIAGTFTFQELNSIQSREEALNFNIIFDTDNNKIDKDQS
jgi:hypothetical protein